jgi:hypothetical protein
MSDQTPNSLIKVEPSITTKYGTAQILIFTAAALACLYIGQFVINNKTDSNIVGGGLFSIVLIVVLVFVCARSDMALYKAQRAIVFGTKRALKTDEMYKFSKKTTSKRAKKFTGLESADDKGRLHFKTYKTFEHESCNTGMCYKVTPADSRDLDAFYAGIEKLYNSVPHGCLHKTIIAQSKTLADLCESYELKLQRKNLPIPVRQGLQAKKKYFEEIKDRVGWMYVIFLGVGYHTDDKSAAARVDEVRETYTKFLGITGIKVQPVTDATEYSILYSQMFHMKDLQGIER